jgi:hypothetical protein
MTKVKEEMSKMHKIKSPNNELIFQYQLMDVFLKINFIKKILFHNLFTC